ncbi:MAG: hypothetical protein M0Q23_08490 [Syntrophales bacterium]|jgi:hypothetical protein|nr:hypothetical protein [Syntrophales bacterium]MCK9528659.1 hypothetical protein [Syntrophales bacterium]MDX9922034.1 hypothetical protein [Syntrophales bacterium]
MSDRIPDKPFPRSYWVVPGRFLAGFYPGDRRPFLMKEKLTGLLVCGIRCVINLQEPDEVDRNGMFFMDYAPVLERLAGDGPSVVCHRMSIPDLGVPSPEFMKQILNLIDETLEQGLPLYVHCWGGRGRTGTVVGCWLVRHGIAEGEDTLRKIGELRRSDPRRDWPSPEMPDQLEMVRAWKVGL